MPELLLAHSLGTSPLVWSKVLPLLPAGIDATAFPLPGHAGAPRPTGEASLGAAADAVVALADRKGIDRFHFAGVSIGGAIGLELALRHPDRLHSVAVVCAVARFGEPDSWLQRAELVRRQGTPVLVTASAQRWFHPEFPARDPDSVGRILHDLSDTDDEAYAWYCEALARFDVRDELPRVAVPVLVLEGDHDEVATVEAGRAMAEAMPRGRFAVVEDSGHQAPIERPEQVAAAIAELIAETES